MSITVRGISKSFGPTKVLSDIDIDIATGELVALLGPSGSGKSTLLRSINLLETPDSGRIVIDTQNAQFNLTFGTMVQAIPARDLARLRSRVGMVFQHFNLWPHKMAVENVAEAPRRVRHMPSRAAGATAGAMLARVGLGAKLTAFPDHLSGGQRQRVAIARALAMRPDIMLFDEPTSALDPELVGEVLQVIEDVAASGMTMLVATHEMGFARKVADRILFMDQGCIVEDARAEDFFERPAQERKARFLEAILR